MGGLKRSAVAAALVGTGILGAGARVEQGRNELAKQGIELWERRTRAHISSYECDIGGLETKHCQVNDHSGAKIFLVCRYDSKSCTVIQTIFPSVRRM